MPEDAQPPFRSVAVVGVGLIGGSIALGVRETWPSARVIGVDRPSVLAHAGAALDRALPSVAELGDVDLVVLAAPVRQNARLLQQLPAAVCQQAVVTDVGGTKRDVHRAARVSESRLRFVGGHPVGGAEQGGFGFARADLFRGRPWIVVPDGAPPADLARVEAFAAGLGALPVRMSAEEHDRVMAFVSHLPQLAASALMAVVGSAVEAQGLRVAGRGLADTTRLASSPVTVWTDICASNADTIRVALDLLIDRLGDLRADLGRGAALDAVFADAARWRSELTRVG